MKNTLVSLSVGFELPTESFNIEDHKLLILNGIPIINPDQIELITSDLNLVRIGNGNDLLLFTYIGRYDTEVISESVVSELMSETKFKIESRVSDYLNSQGLFYSIYK